MAQQASPAQQLEQACLTVLNPASNDAIRAASSFLNKAAKNVNSVMPLHALLRHNNPGVRQLAAIFLRKVIQRHWSKLGGKGQAEFKSSLLKMLMQEPVRDVRNALAELIAKVVKFGQWGELLQFITQASNAPEAMYREVAFKLIDAMSETVGETVLKPGFAQLQPMFLRGLQDQDPSVRVRALRAVNGISEFLNTEKEAKLLQALIEPCVAVTADCVKQNQTEHALNALELFNELLQIQEMEKAVNGYIPQLMQFMLSLVAPPNVDMYVRDQAMTFVQNVAITRCKQFVAAKWLEPLMQLMVPMLNEPLDDPEDDEVTSQRLVVSCVDVLCSALPQKYVGPRMLAMALQLAKSPNWMERKGALEILAVSTQGCFVFMQDHEKEWLPVLAAGFKDPSSDVRESACVALAHFSEKIGASILPHHAALVPLLVAAMRDSESVAMRALYALQFFSEGLMEDFEPYADSFMNACLGFAQSPTPMIRETATGAMGSIAMAVKGKFVKYLGAVVPMLKAFMSLTGEEDMEIRARATEVAGSIAFAVGRAAMGPALQELAALAGGALTDTGPHQYELRQHAYGFFANLAEVLGLDFVPLLPNVMPYLVGSLESDEGVVARSRSETSGLASLVEDDEDDDDEAGPELDENGDPAYGVSGGEKIHLSVRVPFLEEKKMAIAAVAAFGRVLGKPYAPYVEKLLPMMIKLCCYLNAQVRENAVKALPDLLHVVHDSFPSPSGKWERGKFNAEKPLSRQVHNINTPVMRCLLDVAKEDRDLEVVICAVESIDRVIKELGPCAMEPHIEPLLEHLRLIFAKQSFCQALREQFDEDDRDLELFNVAVDCISTICLAAGPTPFGAECIKRLFPSFQAMAHDDRPDPYRALAMGGVAEMAVHVEQAIQPQAVEALKLALHSTQSTDTVTRRNAMYCIGALMQFGGPNLKGAVPNVLNISKSFYANGPDRDMDPPGRDNAVGALARLLLSGLDNLPLPEIIAGIVAGLPLLADTEPYQPIYHAMTKVLRTPATTALVAPHLALLTKCAVFALFDTKLKLIDKSRASLELFVRIIASNTDSKAVLLTVLGEVPPHVAQEIKQKLGL